ncbi:conserved Plasmodium protein, unknown function [Plasmodium ovale wallikeri]|uniref:CBF1-interacting co-repressor CIR N-terminal domain-containing protein n=2 Tax=Plasmodium ovale TaxID=36330 RepID=A0A1A8YSD0_PLAOA|nr:conserved Plasmodium protein, unknown function [Plasmodium ovale wallikeri]SBT34888.1 conserved Plasmodium protein, unknown function [Plasmodium ovale wallikeri]SBT76824.1 conserved Plasmodium protein, unknown function [Plasmodium ovale]
MGGHGGLNILPQKKWNVYRKDIQYKVNYDENKLIKEGEQKEREKNERSFENTISQLKNNISKNDEKKCTAHAGEHINLFIEEEKEINRRNKVQEEFLIKKGHYIYNDKDFNGINCIYDKKKNAKIISDFDKIRISQNEWFLNKRNRITDLQNDQRSDVKKDVINKNSIDRHDHKSLQKKDTSQSEMHENVDMDSIKHKRDKKKKKEKTKKYEHIRKLIKYKKEKEKEKRNRKKHKEKERNKRKRT